MTWKPASWRDYTAPQQPSYDDHKHLQEVLEKIRKDHTLICHEEVLSLKSKLAFVEDQGGFVLQAGDCAERFIDANEQHVFQFMELFKSMVQVMQESVPGPIIPIGRIAGQYGKPRSNFLELTQCNQSIPVFRGDNVHSYEASLSKRKSDPLRLLQGVKHADETLRFIEEFLKKQQKENSLPFFYSSHEALILPLEEAFTKKIDEQYFNLSAHLIWVGNRTNQLGGSHIEYLRGVANPIGLKISEQMSVTDFVEICKTLNPENLAGKLVFIPRFGHEKVLRYLQTYIEATQKHGLKGLWICDPMHGNTFELGGIKTRSLDHLKVEVQHNFESHTKLNSRLKGLHLEMTPYAVTECIGHGVSDSMESLQENYQTYCDPRLNDKQTIELCRFVATLYRR